VIVTAMIDRRIVGVAVALCLSPALSDLVYRTFVVPRLPQWHAVPITVWLLVFSPILLVGLAGGAHLATIRRVIVAGFLMAAGTQVHDYCAALRHSPGHAKSWAIEAPAYFWSVGAAISLWWAIGLLSIGMLARRLVAIGTRFRGSAHQESAKRVT
jgi:hypothetical protein